MDRAFVLASTTMDRHLTYVAMTRHRDTARLYVDGSEFGLSGPTEAGADATGSVRITAVAGGHEGDGAGLCAGLRGAARDRRTVRAGSTIALEPNGAGRPRPGADGGCFRDFA